MDTSALVAFGIALLLVLANGFFVAAEYAFVRIRRTQLDELALTLLSNEVLERTDINRIMRDTHAAAPSRTGELSVAAATAVNPARRPGTR